MPRRQDEGFVYQRSHLDRRLGRKWVLGRKGDDEGFAGHDFAMEPVVLERQQQESNVYPPVAQPVDELVRLHLVEGKFDLRIPIPELEQNRWKYLVGSRGRKAQHYLPDFPAPYPLDQALRLLDLGEDALGFPKQQLTRLGKPHAAAQPVEKLGSKFRF